MKKLNEQSFLLILCGIIGSFIIGSIVAWQVDYSSLEDTLGELTEGFMTASKIIGIGLSALLYGYFGYRVVKNKDEAQGQRYIVVLIVFHILSALNTLNTIQTTPVLSLLTLVCDIAILFGCFKQRKFIPAEVDESEELKDFFDEN